MSLSTCRRERTRVSVLQMHPNTPEMCFRTQICIMWRIFIFNCGEQDEWRLCYLKTSRSIRHPLSSNSCDNLKMNRSEAWRPYGRNLLAPETTNNALLLSEWWNRPRQDCEGYFKSSDCWAITAHVSVQVMYGDPRQRLKETYNTGGEQHDRHWDSPNNTGMNRYYTDAWLNDTTRERERKKAKKTSKRKENSQNERTKTNRQEQIKEMEGNKGEQMKE